MRSYNDQILRACGGRITCRGCWGNTHRGCEVLYTDWVHIGPIAVRLQSLLDVVIGKSVIWAIAQCVSATARLSLLVLFVILL